MRGAELFQHLAAVRNARHVARLGEIAIDDQQPGRPAGDLSTAEGARRVVEGALDELSGLDLLVNAASEGFDPKPVAEVTESDWDAALGATATSDPATTARP